jgi:hypothetical protein
MNGWTNEQLEEEITYEQFLKELEHMKAWISRQPRRRASWLFSVEQWAEGNH